jgi:hypothetical protein
MTSPLFLISGSACLAILIAETSGIIPWLRYHTNLQRLKPLDCALCLAWWMALVIFFLKGQYLEAPIFAATSSIMAVLISKVIRT